jgi:Resolvase, N terminal domain
LESPGNEAWVKEDGGPRRRSIAYYRVSTRAQGRSGLGLEAQQAAVGRFLQSASGDLFAEFTEVESGTKAARPQFNEALRLCRIFSAVLVIAKLDRLARNVALISRAKPQRARRSRGARRAQWLCHAQEAHGARIMAG